MDLNKTVPRKSTVDKNWKIVHYTSVITTPNKNLKRKAYNDNAPSMEKLSTEHQQLPTLTQVHLQESTTGKWKEQEDSPVLLQEIDGRACGL